MAIVRNNKSANVTLPAGGGSVCFKPGEHEYPDDVLDRIDTSRAAVRAYLEPQGEKPAVLERAGESDEPARPSAAELIEAIKESSNPEWLAEVVDGERRSTVVAAAEKRLSELEAE